MTSVGDAGVRKRAVLNIPRWQPWIINERVVVNLFCRRMPLYRCFLKDDPMRRRQAAPRNRQGGQQADQVASDHIDRAAADGKSAL